MALRAFAQIRQESLRHDRWLLLSLVLVTAAAVAGALINNGWPGEVWAFAAGGGAATLAFWWTTGGRASAATWLRGVEGERMTARELDTLDPEKRVCIHDLPRAGGGNWDHVVVGPPGVILLDTKNWGGTTHVLNDELVKGNLRHRGAASRASAAALGEAITPKLGRRPWIEPAVVVWGELDDARTANGVTYLPGRGLCSWLTSLPTNSSFQAESGRRSIVDALLQVAEGAQQDGT